MRNLNDLLKRLSNSLDKDKEARDSIVRCIKECVGFEIDIKNISIKHDTLVIKASSVKKAEIKLKELLLLQDIQVKCARRITRILYI